MHEYWKKAIDIRKMDRERVWEMVEHLGNANGIKTQESIWKLHVHFFVVLKFSECKSDENAMRENTSNSTEGEI